ncbi:hypothetical protein [Paenibacillus polymyxa]|uniref:hypothetical protein n=1 Tax=Paenibacillus polymyxa TaxID=1406 RepID=UPI000737D59B|nr:hypothetical protein [Paenibacillus polymyxa]NEU27705.1 hypothetical protein [Paenibacillus polymyxa]
MAQSQYSVVTYKGESDDFVHRSFETKVRKEAKETAKKWVKEYPEERIYIEWFRGSDGQKGYVNPDGYSLTGTNWGAESNE